MEGRGVSRRSTRRTRNEAVGGRNIGLTSRDRFRKTLDPQLLSVVDGRSRHSRDQRNSPFFLKTLGSTGVSSFRAMDKKTNRRDENRCSRARVDRDETKK